MLNEANGRCNKLAINKVTVMQSKKEIMRNILAADGCIDTRHVVDHTVDGDARGRVGGVQMFAQERAVVDLQTLPLRVQLLSDHQHITIIQVMHQFQNARPPGYTHKYTHSYTGRDMQWLIHDLALYPQTTIDCV